MFRNFFRKRKDALQYNLEDAFRVAAQPAKSVYEYLKTTP